MSRPGQRAALPTAEWQPPTRRDGCVVFFVSEDGTQRVRVDFSRLPVGRGVQEEIAEIVEVGSGPSGTWKRAATVAGVKAAAIVMCRWIASTHPQLESLSALGRADARLIARSFTDARSLDTARSLVGYGSRFTAEFVDEFCRHRLQREEVQPSSPYTERELARIMTMARGIIRQARDRIWSHRQLVSDFRAGRLTDPEQLLVGEVLDHCARTHDFPRVPGERRPTTVHRQALRITGVTPLSLLHPTGRDVWAFAVLLAAQTGLNRVVLDNLRVGHALASAPEQPGVAVVETYKPRRGSRSRGTLALTAFPPELVEAASPSAVPDTSLNSPFGVFRLLVDLTRDTRDAMRTDLAFVRHGKGSGGSRFSAGIPTTSCWLDEWVEPWATDDLLDDVLFNVTFPRLRRTRILRSQRPIDHTRPVYNRYMQSMRPAIEDGFGVVRDALRAEVQAALDRRAMKVVTHPQESEDADPKQDTVLGSCVDMDHSPLDGGQACRRDFLTCLSCSNARALPRHLPMQLLVADRLSTLRKQMSVEEWISSHAGQLAQLEDVTAAYTPQQRAQARAAITEEQTRIVNHLFSGALDPT